MSRPVRRARFEPLPVEAVERLGLRMHGPERRAGGWWFHSDLMVYVLRCGAPWLAHEVKARRALGTFGELRAVLNAPAPGAVDDDTRAELLAEWRRAWPALADFTDRIRAVAFDAPRLVVVESPFAPGRLDDGAAAEHWFVAERATIGGSRFFARVAHFAAGEQSRIVQIAAGVLRPQPVDPCVWAHRVRLTGTTPAGELRTWEGDVAWDLPHSATFDGFDCYEITGTISTPKPTPTPAKVSP